MGYLLKLFILSAIIMISADKKKRYVQMKDYCNVEKEGIVCKTWCKAAPKCGRPLIYKELTDEERNKVEHYHNVVRQSVGADMNYYSYDRELEFLAACYLMQCKIDNDHLEKTVIMLTSTGANASLITTTLSHDTCTVGNVVDSVLHYYSAQKVPHTYRQGLVVQPTYYYREIGNSAGLVQMTWGRTKRVGCAAIYMKLKDHIQLVACAYEPEGNRFGWGWLYMDEHCTKESKNSYFTNMCAPLPRPLKDDTFVAPIKLDNVTGKANFSPINYVLLQLSVLTVFMYSSTF